jgi:predicted nucleic acid-binding protein
MPAAESTPSVAVLDASVAVRWVVPERGTDEAAALLNRPILWVAPRLMLAEVASALRRKVSAGELRAEIAVQALDALIDAVADGTIVLVQDEAFVASALTLALALGHKLPDCLYLAVAERDGLSLATADTRLERLARQRGVPTYAVPSA